MLAGLAPDLQRVGLPPQRVAEVLEHAGHGALGGAALSDFSGQAAEISSLLLRHFRAVLMEEVAFLQASSQPIDGVWIDRELVFVNFRPGQPNGA
jgi:hypothetical protein